jgi:hypothetical protein
VHDYVFRYGTSGKVVHLYCTVASGYGSYRIHSSVCYVGGKVSLLSPASLKKAGVGSPPKKKPKLWKSKWQLATLSGGKKFPSLRPFLFVLYLMNF